MAAIPIETDETDTEHPLLSPESIRFYRQALSILTEAGVPHLIGGAYAYARYTGIERHTKDFDIFILRQDFDRAAKAFEAADYRSELSFPHWLGKAYGKGEDFVDLIFGSGNGLAIVDERWFEHAVEDQVFGVHTRLIPAEEMIWSKGLIMERERYDGADVAHVIRAVGDRLDWDRLLERFGPFWRVLYAHIVLFGFIYPSERSKVPERVVDDLTARLRQETLAGDSEEEVCYGTLISRQQYLKDVGAWGYKDARLVHATMNEADIEQWTAGIAIDGAN